LAEGFLHLHDHATQMLAVLTNRKLPSAAGQAPLASNCPDANAIPSEKTFALVPKWNCVVIL
jgi:hypothetical protein